jgi:hypothetical protein
MRSIDRLYHLAEKSNLPSIMEHGLLSTERLLGVAGVAPDGRDTFLRRHREETVLLGGGITIRDQKPMPPSALAKALDDGMEPADWYALLNGFVFMWSDRERLVRQKNACGGRPQVVLTFDAQQLFEAFGRFAFVSPINSGNARRMPARRGRDTLVPYTTWIEKGWPTRLPSHPPAEFLFGCVIPVSAPYLISVH